MKNTNWVSRVSNQARAAEKELPKKQFGTLGFLKSGVLFKNRMR